MAPALKELRSRGARRAVMIPLFPQYSTSTTASAMDDLHRNGPADMPVTVVERHAARPRYLDLMAALLVEARGAAPNDAHVLFTAHSLPESFTRAGDPYISEVRAASAAIARLSGLDDSSWSLAFQSVGPVGRWHGPSWEEALTRLQGDSVRGLVVQPLSFVSENLETLWDLDIVMRRRCDALGMTLRRVPAPGVSSDYAALLADLVVDASREEGWLP